MPKINAPTIAEHRQHTLGTLLDAMDELILERSFDSIAMRDVAARAGVTRTAAYNYAPDTLTLLVRSAERGSAQVLEAVDRYAGDLSLLPSERLRSIVMVLLTRFARSTNVFLTMQGIERTIRQEAFTRTVLPIRDRIGDRLIDVVRAGVRSGEFAPVSRPELTRALMVGVMQAALRRLSETIDEAEADTVATFLINALTGPARELAQR